MYSFFNGLCNVGRNGVNNFFGGMNFMMIGFLILTVFIVYYLFKDKNINSNINSNSNEQSPMEILEKEFARGKISKDEFIEKKEILNK